MRRMFIDGIADGVNSLLRLGRSTTSNKKVTHAKGNRFSRMGAVQRCLERYMNLDEQTVIPGRLGLMWPQELA